MNNHDFSGYAGGAAQIPHGNTNNDKSRPNSTTNIHKSLGYVGGAAQIQHVNAINGKSCPNSTTNIQDSSQDAKVDLKALIVAVMPIYCLSETINLFFFLFLCVFNKLIIFSVS